MDDPIFVVGCDRSGTSLLTVMLDQSPDLKMIFEAGFLPCLVKHASDYGDFSQARHRWYFIRDLQREEATSKTFAFDKFEELTDEEAESAIRETAPTNYIGAASSIYSAAARKENASRWGEKMPRYISNIDWLASSFPNCHIVHIIRDPRDVAASICRAGWRSNLNDAASYWRERVSTGREQGQSIQEGRYHEVHYEALVQSTEEVLRYLTEKLGIRFNSSMTATETATDTLPSKHQEAYPQLFASLSGSVDSTKAYRWKREMNDQEIAEVEEVAASLMIQLGYEPSGAKVPLVTRGMRWGSERLIFLGKKVKKVLKSIGQ